MENGVVRTASADKKITYGELIGGREFSPKLDPAAPTKDPRSFRIVGNSMPRLDIPAKVFGQFTYMQGFRVPRHVARARSAGPARRLSRMEHLRYPRYRECRADCGVRRTIEPGQPHGAGRARRAAVSRCRAGL